MPEGNPSAVDYIHSLSMEVADLPKVFLGVNENFVSAIVEGALVMAGESVDHDALQDATAASGADILPTEKVVQRLHAWYRRSGGAPTVMITCWVPSARSFTA
jgi:hypothetical protein